jgi:large subunit ribosomal protein L9
MKVILKQDIKGLGKKESLVDVSDGYARNYLIPKGFAVEASAVNINVMKTKNDAEKAKRERELAKAKALAQELEKITVVIATKAGENGKLFGSVTSKDIAEKLKKDFNIETDKKKINLQDSLKSLGTTEVEVKLFPEVTARLTVKVVNEQ